MRRWSQPARSGWFKDAFVDEDFVDCISCFLFRLSRNPLQLPD
jgi:hypothetical protein